MNSYKTVLGIVAVVVGFIGYAPYIKNVFLGKTKPHIFSWFIWGVLETIAFFAQVSKHGEAGTWVIGASAAIALLIAFLALRSPDKQIAPTDWIALAGAIVGIILWQTTKNALLAIICVTVADAFAFYPTFRKGYNKPQEETLFEYALSSLKLSLSLLALGSFNLITALYPASLVLTNGAFVVMSLIRRKQLRLVNENV
jgi:hypothetical protein